MADIELVSADANGVVGNAESFAFDKQLENSPDKAISDDGHYVVFWSNFADNLVPGAVGGVFRKDLATGEITVVSTDDMGFMGSGSGPSISGDGRYVAFYTRDADTSGDSDTADDVYVKDLVTGAVVLVSTDAAVRASGLPSISGDGQRVAFLGSDSTLGGAGPFSVFVKDLTTGQIFHLDDLPFSAVHVGPSLSADGQRIAYQALDDQGRTTLIVKDVQTAVTIAQVEDVSEARPSISADGSYVAYVDGAAIIRVLDVDTQTIIASRAGAQPSISADGHYVAFTSGGVVSVWDVQLDLVAVVANGRDPSISQDGRYVSFQSDDPLVAGDNNDTSDIFRAANPLIGGSDTTAPTVSSIITSGAGIDAGGNGTLTVGSVVTLAVSFSEIVLVDTAAGSPTLSLNNGATATYTGGSGSSSLTFSYTVGTGQSTPDLTVSTLTLHGATIRDAAGNSANVSGAANLNPPGVLTIDTTLDTTPPTITLANDTGASATDGVTNDPTLTGTAAPGTLVTLMEGATLLGGVTADANGIWNASFLFQPLNDGVHTITASNGAGSTSLSFTLDTVTPVPTIALANDTGTPGDNITSDASLTGTAEAGASVEIYSTTNFSIPPTLLGTATADANGTWNFVPSLTDNGYFIRVLATDLAGNQQYNSDLYFPFAFISSAPTIALAHDTGASPTDRITNDPTLTGTAAPGALVTLMEGTTVLGGATADANGIWNASFLFQPLSDGVHTITAGLTSLSFALDTVTPVPTIALANDTGTPGDNITSDASLTGTAEAGASVEIYSTTNIFIAPTLLGTATADANGTWNFVPSLTDNGYFIRVLATDLAGNQQYNSDLYFPLAFISSAPTIALAHDTGASPTDRITNDPTLTGTAAPGALVTLMEGTTVLGGATADANGIWNASFLFQPLSDGVHTITAGLTSLTFTLDTVTPVPTIALANDTGTPGDNITSDASLTGTAEAGASVAIYSTTSVLISPTLLGTVAADANGTWNFVPSLADGGYYFRVLATDLAGNPQYNSGLFPIGLTASAPTIALAHDTGASPTDRITNDPALTGTASPGTPVTLMEGATVLGTVAADANGIWNASFVFQPTLNDGMHTITASNGAGSASLTFTLDTVTPVPTIALANDTGTPGDNITSEASLTGTAEAGASVAIYSTTSVLISPTLLGTVAADANGTWNFVPSLADGGYYFRVLATDLAGNPQYNSGLFPIGLISSAPTIALAHDTGASPTDRITYDPTLTGTGASAFGGLEFTEGTTVIPGTLTTAGDVWTFRPDVLYPFYLDGLHTVTVTNREGSSASLTYTRDSTPPWLTVALAHDTDTPGDNITKDPTITGTTDPGISISIYEGGSLPTNLLGTVTADAGGTWNFVPPNLSPGGHTFYVYTGSDLAGNYLALDFNFTYLPVTIALANDTGTPGDNITSDPTLTGTGAATATGGLEFSEGSGFSTESGVYTFQPAIFSDGVYTITATNPLGVSAALTFTLDSASPTITSIGASGSGIETGGNGILNVGALVLLTVTFDETTAINTTAGTPTLSLNNGATATYTGGSGSNALTFSYTVGTGQGTGDLTISSLNLNGASITDAAGNIADVSGATNFNPSGTLQINNGIIGTLGSDTLTGTAGPDIINAGAGNDSINAGAGDDIVTGGTGADVVLAGSGNDTVVATISDGSDLYAGGDGTDKYDLSQITASVSVSLGTVGVARGSQIGSDTLLSIENAVGGAGSDTITGDNNANVISGGGGNDTLSGMGGNDILSGGAGADALSGGGGDDTFLATVGDGNDAYNGNGGTDTYSLAGTTANAAVNLAAGRASSSATGSDTLASIENVIGSSGNDTITANTAANVFTGGAGSDTFVFASTGAAGITTGRDQITDFSSADKIDVSGIDANSNQAGDPPFVFIGLVTTVSGGLGQLGRGQLGYHYETDTSGAEHTIVEGNINANAAADLQIALAGQHVLTGSEFIL